MREIIYSVAVSLDGFIAGPGGEFDWIPDEPTLDWDAFMRRFDTIIMGRGTWEVVRSQPPEHRPGLPTWVFSDTLDEAEGASLVRSHEAAGVVGRLRAGEGKAIWLMGGGILFRHLVERGWVDQVETAVVPILLGAGIPLLPAGGIPVSLQLLEMRSYPSGIVMTRYGVEKGA